MDIELGSIKAYRSWYLDRRVSSRLPNVKTGLPSLSSVTFSEGEIGGRWAYGVNEAICLDHKHKAPVYDCHCGMYSIKKREDTYINTIKYLMPSIDPDKDFCMVDTVVQGSIDIFGKVIIHEKGYRSEYAKILELFPTVTCTLCTLRTTRQVIADLPTDQYWIGQLGVLPKNIHIWTTRDKFYERLSIVICDRCFRKYISYAYDNVVKTEPILSKIPLYFFTYREISSSGLNEWFLKTKELYT